MLGLGLVAARQWKLDRILPGSSEKAALEQGTWAVASAGKDGRESMGVVVEIPVAVSGPIAQL